MRPQLITAARKKAPTLTDNFAAVAGTTSAATKSFTVPASKTIPVGSLLIVGAVVNGTYLASTCADNSAASGSANTYSLLSDSSWIQGTNLFAAIFATLVTRSLTTSDIITVTHGATNRIRGAAVVAWFDGASHFPDVTTHGGMVAASGSSAAWATGNASPDITKPTLEIVAAYGTDATKPYTMTSPAVKINESTTTVGSSDRGICLGYRVMNPVIAATPSASGTCTNAVWGCGIVGLDYA